MKNVLEQLEPKKVFHFFEEMTRIPHGSGNTAAATAWAMEFAQARGLRCRRDEMGNVVIWKDASPGYEDHPTVMLQGHLDMVCVQDNGVNHDFTKDPLDLYVEDGYIKARGTSLGGDDGIAVAMAMAVLDDDSIPHGPLEAVFTVDEEVGMPGAAALDGSDLKSKYLLNIDSEVEGVLTVGCAGGTACHISLDQPAETAQGAVCTLSLEGLSGGHSGTAIHMGFANANKLLAQCLAQAGYPRLVSLFGGLQDNAIPTSAKAEVLVTPGEAEALRTAAEGWAAKVKAECPQDPGFTLTVTVREGEAKALSAADSRKLTDLIAAVPNGVQAMNPDLPGQVQTSLNLGILRLEDGKAQLVFLVRSSVAAEQAGLTEKLQSIATEFGAAFAVDSSYPPWEYRRESKLRDTMVSVFTELYGKAPVVETVHAGLECGLLMDKIPGLDAVSFGPDIVEIHSTRERLGIDSVERTWRFLLAVLKAL